jgi:hypothetical protein
MATVSLEVPENQIVEWVQRLSPDAKHSVLKALIPHLDEFEALVDYGNQRARELAAKRGLNWDSLSDDQRQNWVDQVLHEA